ncbi:MAG: hypothetical protein CL760_04975 [Chloroflexi bacterium]|nr:hypothetical protein [Chloroflexota bacterium]|tara:strand:- start:1005 stop:1523 length:519 start_codon:yes stop_codon:yes gene_type:complete
MNKKLPIKRHKNSILNISVIVELIKSKKLEPVKEHNPELVFDSIAFLKKLVNEKSTVPTVYIDSLHNKIYGDDYILNLFSEILGHSTDIYYNVPIGQFLYNDKESEMPEYAYSLIDLISTKRISIASSWDKSIVSEDYLDLYADVFSKILDFDMFVVSNEGHSEADFLEKTK